MSQDDPTTYEYTAAELWMQYHYSTDFCIGHPDQSAALVLTSGPIFRRSSYLEYLTLTDTNALNIALQEILKVLLTDFRNPLVETLTKQFQSAESAGTLTRDLIQKVMTYTTSEMALRKPDILAIVAEHDPAALELHEICTVKTLSQTKTELEGKLRQLTTQVVPPAQKAINARQLEQSAITPRYAPISNIEVVPSTWVPPKQLRSCPLTVTSGAAESVTARWACFEPAVTPLVETLVSPGLLPYHIHELSGKSLEKLLPTTVRQDLRKWRDRLLSQSGLRGLELLPQANPLIQRDLLSLPRDQREILAYGAGSVVVVILLVLAFPAVIEIASAVGSGIATSTSSVATLTQAIYPLAQEYATSLSLAARQALLVTQ